MSNYMEVRRMLSETFGQRNQVVIPKAFCRFMGGFEGGAFLNQLIFWSDKGEGEWFYKPYVDWQEEIMITEYQWRKAVRQCEEQGFLETKLKKVAGSPTMHFRFLLDDFITAFMEFLSLESAKSQFPIRENTESIETAKSQNDYMNRSVQQINTSRSSEADDALALFKECHHRLGKFPPTMQNGKGKELLALADQLVDDFGLAECLRQVTVMAERNNAMILEGDKKGIVSPVQYLAAMMRSEKAEEESKAGPASPSEPATQRGGKLTPEGHLIIEDHFDTRGYRIIEIDGVRYREEMTLSGDGE